ncbi:hypothetical protein M0813_11468 [Anaeramoeba flamelloides]|uniref:Uncharacterized protein n=1 Tax=Anaeramoeba flamelloides TaxID=1746091 RepID=A0ABQ8ZFF4_9EUKA|nr:hypothetical protein M0813_11468 [Anaeramoeba flamelloides]
MNYGVSPILNRLNTFNKPKSFKNKTNFKMGGEDNAEVTKQTNPKNDDDNDNLSEKKLNVQKDASNSKTNLNIDSNIVNEMDQETNEIQSKKNNKLFQNYQFYNMNLDQLNVIQIPDLLSEYKIIVNQILQIKK